MMVTEMASTSCRFIFLRARRERDEEEEEEDEERAEEGEEKSLLATLKYE